MRHVRRWYRAVQCRPDETDAQHRGRVSRFETDRTFADLLGRMPEQVTRIFRAAARRAAGELDEQSAGVGLSIFGSLWMGDSSRGVRNILGGSGRVGAAARTRLGRAVVLGAEVTTVREVHDGAEVGYRTADGEHTVRARQVVLAIPAPLARTVLTGLPAEVDRALGTVTYGPFVCMGVITSEDGPTPWDDVYAITTPGLAFDMLFNHANPVRAPGRRAPGGSLMCYAGGAHASALLDLDENVIRDRFLADVLTVLPQVRGRVLEAVVQKWPQGNVYRTPHTDFDEVLNWNDRQGAAVRLAGDYFAELGGTIEAATRSGLAAAAAVRAALRHPAGEHPRSPRSTAPDYADRAGGPR